MRRRLLTLVAATTSLIVIAFLVPMLFLVRSLAEDRVLSAAVHQAQDVAVAAAAVSNDQQLAAILSKLKTSPGTTVGILSADGDRAGTVFPITPAVRLALQGRSLTAVVPGGREVLVPAERPSDRLVVRVFVPTAQLRRGVGSATLTLVVLAVLIMAVTVAIADALARWMLRPVAHLADTAHALASGDLTARAEVEDPAEIASVATALNRLASRIGELLDAERESVADLSHRLRTPLTALRLDADGLRTPAERDRLTADVESLERTVDAVIRESRRPVREGAGARCDAATVVADRVAFWKVLAEDQERSLTAEIVTDLRPVRLSEHDLVDAVDALLQNVFAYTPTGVAIRVKVWPASPATVGITVSDDGPGFGDTSLDRRGASGSGSTGLGLDIVRRTAEASGGRLRLGTSVTGGAEAEMILGCTD